MDISNQPEHSSDIYPRCFFKLLSIDDNIDNKKENISSDFYYNNFIDKSTEKEGKGSDIQGI